MSTEVLSIFPMKEKLMPSQFFCFCANVEQNNKPTRPPKALFWPVIRISLPLCFFFFSCSYRGRRTSNQWDLWIKSEQCRGTLHGPSLNEHKWPLILFDSWGAAHTWRTFEQQHSARAPAFRAPSTVVTWSKDRPALGSDRCHHHHLSRAACPPKPLFTVLGPQGFREG